MPNTNFQTFHQMGSAISDFVKQATGRDNVQNIDMDHVTVAQNHVYDEVDVSGRVVHFSAGEAGLTFEKLLVQIEPVQSGSGVPSPDNIRPITGWTMVNVYQAGQSLEDVRTFRFTFPSEAGVVYGGTLDVTTGTLVVDRAYYDGSTWVQYNASNGYKAYMAQNLIPGKYINDAKNEPISNTINKFGSFSSSNMTQNIIQPPRLGSPQAYMALKDGLDSMGIDLSYLIASPITYHLTPQEVRTLLGQNNIWADTGDIEVKFTNLKELY